MTEVGLIPSLPVCRTIQVEGEQVLEDVLVCQRGVGPTFYESGNADLEAEGRTAARSADRTTYTVKPREGGGWGVQAEGASRATSVHDSKDEAVSRAKKLAGDRRPSQLLVYKKDGTVQSEQTYG